MLGTIELLIDFAGVSTTIHAHVAQRLCTNIILGMDFMNLYNLTIDIKHRQLSIDCNNRLLTVPFDSDYGIEKVPVISTQSVYIPPHSTRSTRVPIPVSSIGSSLFPNYHSLRPNPLISTTTRLDFLNHCSIISFANKSSFPQYVQKGYCVGFLLCNSLSSSSYHFSKVKHTSFGATDFSDESSATFDVGAKKLIDRTFPQIITPPHPPHSDHKDPIAAPFCNNINTRDPTVHAHIEALVKSVENPQHQSNLRSLLSRFYDTFDSTKHNIANTRIHHVINTVPHSPPACKPYPQPDKEEPMYKLMQEFLQAGLICKSHSPYAAPAILVKKKDNTFRFVVDYKKLNLITIKDSSPLPNMEDTIRKLGQGYTYFSKLDLKSGFYQIPINDIDKEKTAFVTPFGLFQFNVLPMGLRNSPPTFQKVMNDTLVSCREFALVYLDDIIIFSKSFDQHLHHLERVLFALQAKKLILNPPKCVIGVTEIDYLGHNISKTRITPMKDKIEAILQIPEPKSLAQANKFIGGLSWYRKFFPNFATTAAPIHAVTNLTKDQRNKFKWSYAQSKAFHELKQMLVTQPLFLHYPVEHTPLILTTDASNLGIGGILQQEVDGELHNLYYHSQLMTPCERKYSTIEKEALAIYKCFARMRTILLGRSIILMTDHCPLCHIMHKTVQNARVDRITHLIQEYNIDQVIHIKGRENCLPDFLSRYANDNADDLFEVEYGLESKNNTVSPLSSSTKIISHPSSHDTNRNLLATMVLRPRRAIKPSCPTTTSVDNHSTSYDKSPDESETLVKLNIRTPPTFSRNQFDQTKLKDEQDKDPDIQRIVNQIHNKTYHLSFALKNEFLHKLITPSNHSKRKMGVIYLPTSMIKSLLQACHDDPMTGAHFSFDRTYAKIKPHYWWPSMRLTIKNYIDSCILCKTYNISRQKKHGHLRPISPPDGPFLLIGIDYCGPLKRTPRENQYVLVITDYFTRHITAIALPNCTAETTAQALFNEYFCKYGVPTVILSDQGSHFRNQLMSNIQNLIGYNHIYSTPYHPQTNGIVERFNSTFVPQISKLQDTEGNNWDEYLQAVVFAYNTGIHKTTKYSPYELVYGRLPRLPIHTRPSQVTFNSPNNYYEQLRKTLRIYHQAAKYHIILQQQHSKEFYDRNRQNPQYKIGDRVLTRIYGIRGKLDPKFSPIPKVITGVYHPIYVVQDEDTHVTARVHVGDLRPILID